MFSNRLNLFILIACPLMIFGAIHSMGLILPPKYYFSISTLAKGGDQPFLIDPPSVSSHKLCALLEQNNIEYPDPISCSADDVNTRPSPQTLTKDQKDRVYRGAFDVQTSIFPQLAEDFKNVGRVTIDNDQMESLLSQARTPRTVLKVLAKVNAEPYEALLEESDSLTLFTLQFPGLSREEAPTSQDDTKDDIKGQKQFLDEDTRKNISTAYRDFYNTFKPEDLTNSMHPIEASDIDNIIEYSGIQSIPKDIMHFYINKCNLSFRKSLGKIFHNVALMWIPEMSTPLRLVRFTLRVIMIS
jgi:hypothetical protein